MNNLNSQPTEEAQDSQQKDEEKKDEEDDNLGSKPTFAETQDAPEASELVETVTETIADSNKIEEEGAENKDDVLVQKETPETNDESEEDDCDDEWITPDNLQTYLHAKDDQAQHNKNEEDNSRKISVEVVTSDFAMQNVLMQIGIPVVSLDGVEIRKIKRFKLRCDGCKTINKKVDIEFCEKCGGHTLSKVSVFANSNGEITFFKGKRMRKNNRGVQFDIPKPKHGRDKNAMILREDQLWVGQNKLRMKDKQRQEDKIKNSIGDHFNDYVSFEHAKKESKKFENDLVYGYGKKNPNIPNKKYSKKKNK